MKIERPEWWPENPYKENVFPMTHEQYVEAIPDERLRDAIAGYISRFAWNDADETIWHMWQQSLICRPQRKDNKL